MEITEPVPYICPPHVSWTVRSKSSISEGQLDGDATFSVLPAQRCRTTNICYSICGSVFAYQHSKYIFIHNSTGEIMHTIEVSYKASKIEFSSTNYNEFFLLLVASNSKVSIKN